MKDLLKFRPVSKDRIKEIEFFQFRHAGYEHVYKSLYGSTPRHGEFWESSYGAIRCIIFLLHRCQETTFEEDDYWQAVGHVVFGKSHLSTVMYDSRTKKEAFEEMKYEVWRDAVISIQSLVDEIKEYFE